MGRTVRSRSARGSGAGARVDRTPPVRAMGLGHTYDSGRRGVAGVDLEARRGERIVLLGPNGSGKTTFARLLATDLRPSEGALELLGHPAVRPGPALRRRLGVALDAPVHVPHLTGLENALLFARAAGRREREARPGIEALLERFDLRDVAQVPVAAYSLGMRRKLLLVEALAHAPELLVLDEPTLGLDPNAVDALAEVVSERSERGTTVVASLNDPAIATRLADRVVFLSEGEVVTDSTPQELLATLDADTVCSIDFDGASVSLPEPPAGVRLDRTEGGLVARFAAGVAPLPRLIESLLDAGVAIRAVRLRAADLGDVFRAVTGRSLERPPAADGEAS